MHRFIFMIDTFGMMGEYCAGAQWLRLAMDFEKIGRTRMMIRLPRHRRQLADLNYSALCDLLERYGIAAMKRDELRAYKGNEEMLAEYDEQCQAMEDQAVKLIASASPRIVR